MPRTITTCGAEATGASASKTFTSRVPETQTKAFAPFAPASTVVTSAIMQAMVATAAGVLAAQGIEPPLLRSGNVDGGHDWNARVMSEYGDRIFYQQ